MAEPRYVYQTFDKEHTASQEDAYLWWYQVVQECKEAGCKWFRFSWNPEGDGLLLEAWDEQPEDEGKRRWLYDRKSS